MTSRSIIDIDVRDQAFRDFQALFEKYQTQVDSLPGAWSKVDRAIKSTSNPIKQIGAIATGMNEKLKAAQTTQEKFRISAQATGKAFGVMASSTTKLASNIKDVTVNLLRWASLTSVFSGLLGAGGLFGLNRLGEAAANSRREAQGLGISAGEHTAAQINYQKLVNVDSMLSKINEAKYDVTKRSAFAASGMNAGDWENQNAAQIMTKLLPQIKNKFSEVGGTKQAADATGLTQFVSMEDLMRLKAVTRAEIDAATASYEADKKSLDISDKTQASWQAFNTQLQRSGLQIENTLQRGLVGLTGPISRLSEAFAKAVQTFLSSPKIGKWIDQVGGAMERFAKYLTSEDFGQDIKSFLDAIDTFAGSLWNVAKVIGKVFNFGDSKTLKASEYRKLDELEKLDPAVAKVLRDKLTLSKASFDDNESKLDLTNGFRQKGAIHQEQLDAALAGPNGARIKELIDSLNQNTTATVAMSDRVKPMIDLKSLHGDKAALRIEAARQMAEAGKFADIEKRNNLPPGLLQSVEKQESAGNPDAVSPKGARGPFQFMPATWAQYGKGGDVRDEKAAASAAGDKFADLFKRYNGDTSKALAAYNWGEGNLDRKGMENAPQETRDYVAKILKDMARKGSSVDTAPGYTPAPVQQAPRTLQQNSPLNITISKSPGADVFTTVNNLGYAG